MRSVWLLALATFGCRGILGIDEPITATDAASDAISCAMWQPQGFDPCALGAPLPALHFGPGQYTFKTDATGGVLDNAGTVILRSELVIMQPDSTKLPVLSVVALTLDPGATLDVIGGLPLLVVAWSTMSIDGAIDAGSRIGVQPLGANANVVCEAGTTGINGTDATASGGSGGGGGGGFQGIGGHGGTGGGLPGVVGGAGGTVAPAIALHGGCPGGASGTAGMIAVFPATLNTQAQGGAGGGALRLVARDSITVAGAVSANGAGGAGAPMGSACGGGGGGAGGYVGLEAPAVTISGAVTANGGGGGGGGATNDVGRDGADGKVDIVSAPGGATAAKGCGRPGGAGSAQMTLGGADVIVTGSNPCGGGGGGGAAGFVVVSSPQLTETATAKISPPALMQ